MKRTALIRKAPLRKVSKNKSRILKRFVPPSVIRAVKERSGGLCERKLIFKRVWIIDELNNENHIREARCSNEAMNQPHHILPRSQGGKHEVSNLLDLCFDCHRWAHDNPKQAEVEGILKRFEFQKPVK